MNVEQLRAAFLDAVRRRDHDSARDLLERLIDRASGLELADALSLKAGYLMLFDPRQSIEALSLVEQSLELASDCPWLLISNMTRGLGLCSIIGDVQRATQYEQLGHQLVRDHANDPSVRMSFPALFLNLSQIASLRRQPAQAYWYLLQALRFAADLKDRDDEKSRCTLFVIHIKIAEACLEMKRTPEADEALGKAKLYITALEDEVLLTTWQASHLLETNQPEAAAALLDELQQRNFKEWPPGHQAQFHLTRSRVAQDLGDVKAYHGHLSQARDIAATHGLDFMLCQLQRILRSPIIMEGVL